MLITSLYDPYAIHFDTYVGNVYTLTNDSITLTAGTLTSAQIIDTGLTANLGVYTDGSKQLTSTAPTSGVLGYWSRAGTTVSTATAGDAVTTTGTITGGTLTDGTASLTSGKWTEIADIQYTNCTGLELFSLAFGAVGAEESIIYTGGTGTIAGGATAGQTGGGGPFEAKISTADLSLGCIAFGNILCDGGDGEILAGSNAISGCLAGGHVYALSDDGIIRAITANGNIAWGSVRATDQPGNITSTGEASVAIGYVLASNGDTGTGIGSSGYGSLARGYVGGSGNFDGRIVASGAGATAQGWASGGDLTATNTAAFASGYASEGKAVTSTSYGTIAMGLAVLGSITSSGLGSVALGDGVICSGHWALAFGTTHTNATSNSLSIGFGAVDWLFSGTNLLADTTNKINFRDTAISINSANDGYMNLTADTAVRIGDGAATNNVEIDSGGKVVFVGGAGLPYGEIYTADASDTITIAVTGKANKVQITSFSVDGVSNNTTPDHTNDHITITKAGMYLCTVSMHAISVGGGGADNYGYSVYKNNGATEFANLHGQRDLAGGGGDEGSMSLSGIIDLAVNDTIEVWIWNNTNADDIVIDDINLSLVQVGGT